MVACLNLIRQCAVCTCLWSALNVYDSMSRWKSILTNFHTSHFTLVNKLRNPFAYTKLINLWAENYHRMKEFIKTEVHQDLTNPELHLWKYFCNTKDLNMRLAGFSQRSALKMRIFCPQVRKHSGKHQFHHFLWVKQTKIFFLPLPNINYVWGSFLGVQEDLVVWVPTRSRLWPKSLHLHRPSKIDLASLFIISLKPWGKKYFSSVFMLQHWPSS